MDKQQFLIEVNHIIESGHNDFRLGELYDKLRINLEAELMIKEYGKEKANDICDTLIEVAEELGDRNNINRFGNIKNIINS